MLSCILGLIQLEDKYKQVHMNWPGPFQGVPDDPVALQMSQKIFSCITDIYRGWARAGASWPGRYCGPAQPKKENHFSSL
jgi:hypothetical protein